MAHKQARITTERLERLRRLDVLMARGGYNAQEMADRLGMTPAAVCREIEWIRANWWVDREQLRTAEVRAQRIRELEAIRREALEAWERSKQAAVRQNTTFEDVTCEDCGGRCTTLAGTVCLGCEGLGYTTEERTETETKGKPGDVTFLNTAITCTKELCKLEAAYKEPVQLHRHMIHGEVDVEHTVKEKDFTGVDPELVIQYRALVVQMEAQAREAKIAEAEAGDAAAAMLEAPSRPVEEEDGPQPPEAAG